MKRLRRWWRDRQRLTPDYCRTCDVQLRVGRVYEVRSGFALVVSDQLLEVDEAEAMASPTGGTYGAVTYCRRHAPKGAVRV